MISFIRFIKYDRRLHYIGLGALAIVAILIWLAVFYELQPPLLKVVFFDVGQGESIFIETPEHHQILIDGGPYTYRVLEKLAQVMPFYDRSLDLIFLTHPNYDHLKGLLEVMERFEVGTLFLTGVFQKSKTYEKFLEILALKGVSVRRAQAGQVIRVTSQKSEVESLNLMVLWPEESFVARPARYINDTSIVLKASWGRIDFLLTGDIGKRVEKRLLKLGPELESEVLKVAHHGSKYSSWADFVQRVKPQVSVISAGRNNHYGYPTPEVLDRLSFTQILRTDIQGDIFLYTDGKSIWVYTALSAKQ